MKSKKFFFGVVAVAVAVGVFFFFFFGFVKPRFQSAVPDVNPRYVAVVERVVLRVPAVERVSVVNAGVAVKVVPTVASDVVVDQSRVEGVV